MNEGRKGRGLRSICVFCGSRFGSEPAFTTAARALGTELAERGKTLVYGGAKVGLMGVLADAALEAGGHVVGILPNALVSKEIAHDGLAELHLTSSMHERKERMIEMSDAFVSLPGGFGTYDELFEVLTLAQIGLHDKPSAFLNVNGYFDGLLDVLKFTIASEFAAPEHEGLYVAEPDAKSVLDALDRWTPPPLGAKWTDRRAVNPETNE